MNVGKIWIAFSIQLLFTQQAEGQQNRSAIELDSIIISNMEQSGMVGVGAAVIVDKQVVWMKGYGYADKERSLPYTPNTIMNIASISKTFTGVCVMKALEEGKLSLDEDINTYLPFKVVHPYFPDEKITLRHLATHTSGITDREPLYSNIYYYGGDSPVPLGEFLKSYFDQEGKNYSGGNFLNHRPGTYWEYSNIATALAGYIVEQVTGQSLNEYSKQHIFKPLGMKNTGWFKTEIDLSKYTTHYDKQGDSLKVIPFYGLPTYPDGGVRTSVSELSNYFIALLNGGVFNGHHLLKQGTIKQMQAFQFNAMHKPENINPGTKNEGLFWTTKDGGKKIGYGGTDPGVKTEMLADLSGNVAVILFTNTTLNRKDLFKYYFNGIFDELFKYGYFVRDHKMQSTVSGF